MPDLAICSYCDTVHRRVELDERTTARCVTCDAPLYKTNADLGAMLAVAITAAVAVVIANTFPLVTLTSQGQQTQATLWRAIAVSYDQDLPFVALVLAVTLVVAPVFEIGCLLWILVPLCAGARPLGFVTVMRALRTLRPWRMVEVFLLGVVVAIVKLSALATATPRWGVYGVAAVALALAALASFDQASLWRRADHLKVAR
ncbi:MAG TPA: paraquat-inducible protein A [Kofleriaceae bacterium]|jgi:paraquat-inducible protein A|nr:paraquat-inducible protein A [Kofleriaceae bacterium]